MCLGSNSTGGFLPLLEKVSGKSRLLPYWPTIIQKITGGGGRHLENPSCTDNKAWKYNKWIYVFHSYNVFWYVHTSDTQMTVSLLILKRGQFTVLINSELNPTHFYFNSFGLHTKLVGNTLGQRGRQINIFRRVLPFLLNPTSFLCIH